MLQDGSFQRVGGDRTLKVDVRVIAATNRNLSKEVAAGRFREDLWYRLNVFPITVPPLRQRKEDIPHAGAGLRAAHLPAPGSPRRSSCPTSVVQALQAHDWPGNVRELQNVIEQAVLVSDGGHLRLTEDVKLDAVPATGPDAVLDQSLEDDGAEATSSRCSRRPSGSWKGARAPPPSWGSSPAPSAPGCRSSTSDAARNSGGEFPPGAPTTSRGPRDVVGASH